jgi:hypothetical protein
VPKISLWGSGHKGNNYRTMDRWIAQFFVRGGTAVYVHMYIGPYQQDYPMPADPILNDGTTIPAAPTTSAENGVDTSIQDVLFLENRDRHYSSSVFELRGVYNLNDLDFDLRQFGLFLQNDTLFIEFHLNDMISSLGRKLMVGDVLELPHRRDETTLDDGPPLNKFYVIEQASRSAGGYAPTWWPHIWRVKVSPMPASQEFDDILAQQQTNPYGFKDPGTIGSILTTVGFDLDINDAVVAEAKASVPKRYFETQQFWMVTPENPNDNPWVFAGDGIPPNGATLLGAGHRFPTVPVQNDYYLRTDYHPSTLFMWNNGKWQIQEQDWRSSDWSAAHRLLLSFINNDNISTFSDSTTAPEKVALSKAIKPRADF